MKRITFARLAVLMLAVAGLALQGCGGDDNGVNQGIHDQVVMERDQAQQDLMDAEAERDQAQQDLMDAEQDLMDTQQDLMDTEQDLMDAEQDLMDAEGERDQAQEDLMDSMDAAMQAEMNTRAPLVTTAMQRFYLTAAESTALGTELGADVPIPSTGNTPTTGYQVVEGASTSLMVEHTADGVMVTPNMVAPLQFEEYAVDADNPPPMIDGWDGTTLSRMSGVQTLYAYTDVIMEAGMPFSSVHGMTVTVTTDNIAMAESSAFPVVGEGTQDFTEARLPVPGMFDGVSGTFDCVGAGCDVDVIPGADGALTVTANTGTFVFTPNDPSERIMVASDEYLYFGFWLHKPSSPGQAHRFATLFGAGQDASVVTANKIGRARYEGPAAGKYVTRDLTDNIDTIGIFTATAKLLADFEVDPTDLDADRAPANEGIISGSVSDFMDNYGESLGNWRVTLMAADLIPATPEDPFTSTTMATIGGSTATGNWEGQFFGDDVAVADDPPVVAGRFDVHNDHATLSGAFGARLLDE